MTSATRLQLTLMKEEASTRLADAAVLEADLHRTSDSGYLLRLLAFELLLKAAAIIYGKEPPHHHRYQRIWSLLPQGVRQRTLADAAYRMAGVSDYCDIDALLSTWSSNFVAMRYPFEKYLGLTEHEYIARGNDWVAAGSTIDDADFVYHPTELLGLTEALLKLIEKHIALPTDASSA